MALIDPVMLKTRLGALAGRFDVDALDECDSTNSELMRRAERGAPSGTVIVADRQSAGRGRRGRSWLSSPETSLTFSLFWRFPGNASRLSGLSLAVGVGLARALNGLGGAGIRLKWPNDVLLARPGEFAKLAGILIELSSDRRGTQAIVGIGLNLRLPETIGAPSVAALPAAALEQIVPALPERHVLFAQLLAELAVAFDRFAADGFAALRDDWHARHAWQDRPVRLLRDGRVEKEGICAGADADGALLVRTPDGIERCLSGDVSLRPL